MSNLVIQAPTLALADRPDSTLSPAFNANEKQHSEFQSELRSWIEPRFQMEFNDGRCFAITFLFVEGISREKAIDQYTNFICNLNRKIYGNSYKRFPNKKRVKNISVIEGGAFDKNYHFHSIFVNPVDRDYSDENFMELVKECWLKQPKSMKNPDVAVKVDKVYSLDNWIGYLTKSYTKENTNGLSFQDSIDTVNSYF